MKYMNILPNKEFSKNTSYAALGIALLLLYSACSWEDPYVSSNTSKSSQAKRTPNNTNSTGKAADITPLNSSKQKQILQAALKQVGRPYRFGGNNPNGFDCSGLVQYSYADAGLIVPRTTSEQLKFFTEIPRSQLQAGDVVFFRINAQQRHVAIMLNANDFVHAPSSGKTVSTTSFSNPYWKTRFLKAARYY